MGIAERQGREKAQLRKRILTTAREIIRQEGYDALTIRKIATRIEYSPMALYSHFADKGDILHALAREAFEKIERVLPPTGGEPLETLRKAMLTYIQFGLKHAEEYQLVFMTRRDGEGAPPLEDSPDSLPDIGGKKAFLRLLSYVQDCITAGKVRGDAFVLARVLWAGIHGAVALQITQTRFPFGPKQQLSDLLVDVLLQGIQAVKGLSSSP